MESHNPPSTKRKETFPRTEEVSEAFHYYELVADNLNASKIADRFHDLMDTVKGRSLKIGATGALIGAGALVLTGCVNHPTPNTDNTSKPHHTTSQEATPSSTPTETPATTPEHSRDPLPQSLERLQNETLEYFNNEQWDTKLAYASWLENQALTPKEFADQVQHMTTTNPYAHAPLPTASPANTPDEIVTINNYQIETVFAQNNLLDAQKMLDAIFSHGTNSEEYSYWEPLLEQQAWPGPSPQEITSKLDGPVETIESATSPRQDAVGGYEVDITWPGEALGNYGYLPRATGGTTDYVYHTYQDYKGFTVGSWFVK